MSGLAAGDHERLEDGYGPGTPPGDNLVADFARAEADAYGALVASVGGRVEQVLDGTLTLADAAVGSPFGNLALLERPAAPDGGTAAIAAACRRFFDGHPGGPFLLFSAWPIGDLRGHGFAPVGHPPLMVRPAGLGPALTPALVERAGVRIEPVADAEALAAFEQTLVEAYPTPELLPYRRGAMLGPPLLDSRWRLFLAWDGDRPVATAAAWVDGALTTVELVSARPEMRGRAIGAVVTAAAADVAGGSVPSVLISSDLGQPTYRRLGFASLLRYTLWLGLR
jgi:hypothetical protein